MNRIYSLLVFTVLLSCSDNEEDKKIEVPFTGITQTNKIGGLIGEVDTTDWKIFVCKTGSYIGLVAPKLTIPFPAYPNPTNSVVTLPINFGKAGKLKLTLKRNQNTIETTFFDSLSVLAGAFSINLDLAKYESGIYRLEYEATIDSIIYSSFGDIKIQK